MIFILWLLIGYLFILTFGLVDNAIGAFFSEETKNIIICIVGVIGLLIGLAFWFSAKEKEIFAWRSIWIAATILCLTVGWYSMPKILEDQLFKKSVATNVQLEGVKSVYPIPKTEEEKEWVYANELEAQIADLRWQYYKKINAKKNYRSSIFNFSIGLLCFLCVLFADSIIEKIKSS